MTAIYKRELKAYFHSFIGWLFLAVNIALLDLYFAIYNLFSGYPYTSYVCRSVVIIFIITIPILTMRSLSEEKKNRTDQLILTAPVKISGIVMGKYLAMATVFTVPVLMACLFPLIMSFFGTIPYGENYVAILAFALYGYACIAIGLFFSSLTESQVIAAVLSFLALFLGFLMDGLCNMISRTGNLLTTILRVYDFQTPFVSMMEGTLNLASCLYFVTVTVLFLFLTCQSIQKRRYDVSVKNLTPGAYSTGMIILAVAAAVFMNLLASQLPERYVSIDVSGTKMFSITEETKQLLSSLDKDVTIYMLDNQGNDTRVDNTLSRYADYPHVKVEYIDPATNPRFAAQYTNQNLTVGSLIVVSGERSKAILQTALYDYTVDYTTYQSTITGYDAEGQLTSAIAYVTGDLVPKVYALTGHGETTLSRAFAAAIEKDNIELATLNLMQAEAVPEDCEALFIIGPVSDINAEDTEKLMAYVEQGGDLYVVTTLTDNELPNFAKLLNLYGLSVSNSLIVEGDVNHYAQSGVFLLPEIRSDEVTKAAKEAGYIFAPYASPIYNEQMEGVIKTELLVTTNTAYAKKVQGDAENTGIEFADGDEMGPFPIGMKAVRTVAGGESELILYSALNLLNEGANAMVSGNNQRLFSGGLTELVQLPQSVSIPVKEYQLSSLLVDQRSFVLLTVGLVVVLPLILLITGFVIWFQRRRK